MDSRKLLKDIRHWLKLKGYYDYKEKIPLKKQKDIFEHCAMLVNAGMPLDQVLETISRQIRNNRHRQVIEEVLNHIRSGKQLSEACKVTRLSCDPYVLGVLEAGEYSGSLHSSLIYISKQISSVLDIRGMLIQALMYPCILVIVSLMLVLFMILGVFPKITPVFLSLKIPLPVLTRIMLNISEFLRHHTFVFFLGSLFSFFTFWIVMKISQVQNLILKIALYIPLFLSLYTHYNASRIFLPLGILSQSGMSLIRACELVQKNTVSSTYSIFLSDCIQSLKRGEGFYYALELHRVSIPEDTVAIVSFGEQSGKLGEYCIEAGKRAQKVYSAQLHMFTAYIEPALMIALGGIIACISLSIILPIYGLSQGLSGSQ